MKIEKMLTWAIPLGIGGAVLWWLTQQPAPTVARVPAPAVVAPAPSPIFIGSATGQPAESTVMATGSLLSMASSQLGIPASELVTRSLRPQDIGLTSWNHTSTAANVWDNFATATVADNTFIAFGGVSYGGTNFSQMRINAGASVSGIWPLAFIAGLVSQVYYAPQPVIAQQNQPVIIDIISKGVATEAVNIMGTVVERAGITIA